MKIKRKYGPTYGQKTKFTVDVKIFCRRVRFFLNVSAQEMQNEVAKQGRKLDLDGLRGAHFTMSQPSGEIISYVWIPNFYNDLESLEVLAHETLHAATGILADTGISYQTKRIDHPFVSGHDGTDEVLTHLFGFLFFEAMKNSRLTE